MSTRADFYVGRAPHATWVGSIGHDAFVDNLAPYFEGVTTEEAFRASLAEVFASYGEISAECGWPWPWPSSVITGTVIAFDEGQPWVTHHSGCWAPLAHWGQPGAERCVFPDMVAEEAATPEGQLRIALRHNTGIRLKAGAPVLPSLVTRLTYLLDRAWLHSHEADGQLRMLTPLHQLQNEAFDLARVLQGQADNVRAVVAAQQAADGETLWSLASWACEHFRPYYSHDSVCVPLTDDLPVHFGQPLQRHPGQNMHLPEELHLHVEPVDEAYRQGRALFDQAMDRIPFVHTYALAHELTAHGILHVKDEALEAWLNEARPEFGGESWLGICNTAAGRLAANKAAADLMWQP